MLQVNFLRQNTELAKKKLAIKHFANLNLVDEVIAIDDQRKLLQASFDDIQSKVNTASKEIGGHMAKGEKDKAEALKNEVAEWKKQIEPLKEQMAAVEVNLQQVIVQFPNLPHDLVPLGKTPEENEVVRVGGETPKLHAEKCKFCGSEHLVLSPTMHDHRCASCDEWQNDIPQGYSTGRSDNF